MPQAKFYAVGPYEGKTATLDHFYFVDGACTFEGSDQDIAAVAKVMREQYQAYPEAELEAAKQAFDEAQAQAALEPEHSPAVMELNVKQRHIARRFIDEGLDPEAVYGPGEAADQMRLCIANLKAEDGEPTGEEHEEPEAGETGGEHEELEPDEPMDGGGEQPPEGAKIETVADALQALDPANNDHWTSRGVPSIDAMAKLLGRSVTRAEIEAVAPDYTRSVAKAAKAA